MALRRQRTLCLFCQCRQSSIGRRRAFNTTARSMVANLNGPPEESSFFLDSVQRVTPTQGEIGTPASLPYYSAHFKEHQDDLPSFEALLQLKNVRKQILSSLSNTWPKDPQQGWSLPKMSWSEKQKHDSQGDLKLPEANAALIPHATFRYLVLNSGLVGKPLRRVLRAQLLRATWPREIYKVLAVYLSSKEGVRSLAVSSQAIARALYRCRVNVSDPEVLRTIGVIMSRFKMTGIPVDEMYLGLGLRFAARSRSLESMKKFLRLFRETGQPMSVHAFRSVIAKFSIGRRGLGEIRNGRWKRDDLLQVLKGFDDCKHLPPEQQYHLGAFLDRNDWQFLHGWIAVLARCRDSDAVWHEWELWKQSPGRLAPRRLGGCAESVTTKFRGEYWFLDHMLYAGDLERAWEIFEQSDVTFATLRRTLKYRLLERPELASQKAWDGGMREALLEKYDYELLKIENALGVSWERSDPDPEEGSHQLVQDQWETLERLGADDWKLEPDFGFPYETKDGDVLLVPDRKEREIHEAEERGLVVYEAKDG